MNMFSLKSKLNISDDDFASPITFKKINQKSSKVDVKIKNRRTNKKKQITLDKLLKDNLQYSDVNPEDLQVALALSKSESETNNSNGIEDSSGFEFHKQEKIRTLLEFGFKTAGKKVLTDYKAKKKEPAKKSKFRFISPTLVNRTEDERQSLINSKLLLIISQQKESEAECEDNEYELVSNELMNLKCSECSVFNASLQSRPSFYISGLNILSSSVNCGTLLKEWNQIPLRHNIHGQLTEEISSSANNENYIKITSTSPIQNIENLNTSNDNDQIDQIRNFKEVTTINHTLKTESNTDDTILSMKCFNRDVETDSLGEKEANFQYLGNSSPDLFDDESLQSFELMNVLPIETKAKKLLNFSNDQSHKNYSYGENDSSGKNLSSCRLLENESESRNLEEKTDFLNLSQKTKTCGSPKVSNELERTIFSNKQKELEILGSSDSYSKLPSFPKINQLHQYSQNIHGDSEHEYAHEMSWLDKSISQISKQKTQHSFEISKSILGKQAPNTNEEFLFNAIDQVSELNNTIEKARKLYFSRDSLSLNITEHIEEILSGSYKNINSLHMSNDGTEGQYSDVNSEFIPKENQEQIDETLVDLDAINKNIDNSVMSKKAMELTEDVVYISDNENSCAEEPEDNNSVHETFEQFLATKTNKHKVQNLNNLKFSNNECLSPLRRFSSFSTPSSEQKVTFNRNKSEPNISPNNKFVIKTTNVTPLVNYDKLSTPEVVKKLDTFGLKPVKRKRAINLLKHIYEATHPVLDTEDQSNVKKRQKINNAEVLQKNESENLSKNVKCKNLSNSRNHLKFCIEDIPESDIIFEKQCRSKVPTCQIPLQIVWHNFLLDHPEIFETILCYEPLHIDVIQKMLKEQGFKFLQEDLITFFDRKCITIRIIQK